MGTEKFFWRKGEMTRLADTLGVSLSNLSDVLHRRRGVSKERAKLLETAAKRKLNFDIPFEDWLFNKTTKHPAFFGKPIKK